MTRAGSPLLVCVVTAQAVACGPATADDFAALLQEGRAAEVLARYDAGRNDASVVVAIVGGAITAGNDAAVQVSRRVLRDPAGVQAFHDASTASTGSFLAKVVGDSEIDEAAIAVLSRCCAADLASVAAEARDRAIIAVRHHDVDGLGVALDRLALAERVGAPSGASEVLSALHEVVVSDRLPPRLIGWDPAALPSTREIVAWDLAEGTQGGARDVPRPDPLPESPTQQPGACAFLEVMAPRIGPPGRVSSDLAERVVSACSDPRRGPKALQFAATLCSNATADRLRCERLSEGAARWTAAENLLEQRVTAVFDQRAELGRVKAELSTLEANVRGAKQAEGAFFLEGILVGQLEPRQYEVARHYGANLILETTVTEYTSTGRIGLWVQKMPPTEVLLNSGFTRWVDVVLEHPVIAVGQQEIKQLRAQADELAGSQREARRALRTAWTDYLVALRDVGVKTYP